MDYGLTAVLVPFHLPEQALGVRAFCEKGAGEAATDEKAPAPAVDADAAVQARLRILARLAQEAGVDQVTIQRSCLVVDVGAIDRLPEPGPELRYGEGPAALQGQLHMTAHPVDVNGETEGGTVSFTIERGQALKAALLAFLCSRGLIGAATEAARSGVPLMVIGTVHDDRELATRQQRIFSDMVLHLVNFMPDPNPDVFRPPKPASAIYDNPERYLGPDGMVMFHQALVGRGLLDRGMPLDELLEVLDARWLHRLQWPDAAAYRTAQPSEALQ